MKGRQSKITRTFLMSTVHSMTGLRPRRLVTRSSWQRIPGAPSLLLHSLTHTCKTLPRVVQLLIHPPRLTSEDSSPRMLSYELWEGISLPAHMHVPALEGLAHC